MFIDAVEAKRGVQVPVGNIVHTAEFAFRVAGVHVRFAIISMTWVTGSKRPRLSSESQKPMLGIIRMQL